MHYELKNNSLLYIGSSYGGNQSWYPNFFHKQSGCGPTTAAYQMAYLALSKPDFRSLYEGTTLDQATFTQHMQELFKYVKPGMMGVNHVQQLESGVLRYAHSKGLTLKSHHLSVDDPVPRTLENLQEFLVGAFEADAPIAFLNLSRGQEHRLQNWHWITITSVDFNQNTVIATASDEGRKRVFDLGLWYQTTPMHGGLVWFTA